MLCGVGGIDFCLKVKRRGCGTEGYLGDIFLGMGLKLVDEFGGFAGAVISQIPPAFSACKVNGERAYKRARRGDEVTRSGLLLVAIKQCRKYFCVVEYKYVAVTEKVDYIFGRKS